MHMTSSMRFGALLVSVLLVAPAAEAQLAAVRLGAKVRVEAKDVDTRQVIGTVVLRSGDVITIRRATRYLLTLAPKTLRMSIRRIGGNRVFYRYVL